MPPSREAMKTTAGSRSTRERYLSSSVNGGEDSDWLREGVRDRRIVGTEHIGQRLESGLCTDQIESRLGRLR